MSRQLLTWPAAAEALGLGSTPQAGRRLRDAVMAREKRTGKLIATRLGGQKAPKTRISIAAIEQHLPEMMKGVQQPVRAQLAAYLQGLEGRTRERAELAVAPALAELAALEETLRITNEKLAAAMRTLAELEAEENSLG